MKIRNKKIFTIKDLEDGRTYSFDDDKIKHFGTRLNILTKSIEYFFDIEDYDPLIVSKEDFEQLKKYMEEERDVVWGNEDED
ncbi:hypothetical protein [Lactobacillus sp.]|uniref:hypothetical protein n=1 Tax=Lactobacillus sp. TaxID=1591 RepID=UPI00258ED0CF|nr:hypothetical protein [Lactobacillus sp.]MCO6529065.1 hypothetical protein [Lactobacillus sp.]